jgi:hypothetical protein
MNLRDGSASTLGNLGLAAAAYNAGPSRVSGLALGDRAPMIIKSRTAGRGSAPWYLIRVGESTRDRAEQLCSRLESIGDSCLVYRN